MQPEAEELRLRDAEALVEVAAKHALEDRDDMAEALYRRALALAPKYMPALIRLSEILLARGAAGEAVTFAKAATREAPDDAESHMILAAALMKVSWPGEASKAYGHAVEKAPHRAQAWSGLARAQIRTRQFDRAEENARRALALDAGCGEAWYALGAALQAFGKHASAREALERAIACGETDADVHLQLAFVYCDLECREDAERSFHDVLAADPANKEAHIGVSSLYYQTSRITESANHARLALALDSRLMAAHQNLARIYADEGREAEAKAHRDKAYQGRSLLVSTAPDPELRVLVLTTTTDGNTPDRYLLPAPRYTRLYWFIEYASEAEIAAPPACDVVFNAIADPDFAGDARKNVARFEARWTKPFVNDPQRIASMGRQNTAQLLSGIEGIVVPRTIRLSAARMAPGFGDETQPDGLSPPFLIRPIGTHGGEGMVLAKDRAAAAAYRTAHPADHYLTQFHDYRSADGFYRKYRMFFVDRRPFPYHLAISRHWMVHYVTSAMGTDEALLAEELRFLSNPEAAIGARAMRALDAIGRRVDLDFFGLDFSILPDGHVLVFECNATMLIHSEPDDGRFAAKNPYIERILSAFRALLRERSGA